MFTTIITFLIVIGILILVHELGHFTMAKRAGVKVEEFGFGYPPRIFSIKKGETIYSLNLLPLGGFVKIAGENGPEEESEIDDERAFYNKSLWKRTKILSAGIFMNIVLAMVLLSFGYWLGLPAVVEDDEIFDDAKVQITQVVSDSPAQEADLKIGDSIIGIGLVGDEKAQKIYTIGEVQSFVNVYKGEEIILVIERGKEVVQKKIMPRIDHPEDEGALGVGLARTAIISYPWYASIYKGIISTFQLTVAILLAFYGLFRDLILTGSLAPEVAGPVGIFNVTGQAAKLGFIYILQFTALFSINLAILNGLPFPALDGGRLLFILIEKIKGSPVNRKVEAYFHMVGFALLMLLMIAITWRDIIRFF